MVQLDLSMQVSNIRVFCNSSRVFLKSHVFVDNCMKNLKAVRAH